jgi:hypothetical protein
MPTDAGSFLAASVNASMLLTTRLSFNVAAMSAEESPFFTSTSTFPVPVPV